MNILRAPKSYLDLRALLRGLEAEERDRVRKAFFKKNENARREIEDFNEYLMKAREELSLPIEQTKKFGRVMIWDIDYFYQDGKLKWQKYYIPYPKTEFDIIDKKKRAGGDD